MPQRIGVLTFHRCINFGSFWQARCLVEGLRARGHDAVLLDHQSRRIDLVEWRCALRPDAVIAHNWYRAEYVSKTRRFFEAFETLPLSEPFPLDQPQDAGDYDLVLVGSDEVFNLRHPWFGGKKLFYGEGLSTKRLASYAASFGNQPADEGLSGEWAERLRRFDQISVRDHNSLQLVEGALGFSPAMVLDPCLQWADLVPKQALENEAPYAVVYGHGFPEWFQKSTRSWADRHGLKLLSLGYHNGWADEQRIDVGPFEFAALMTGSSAVATNFFHGCVFALINGKPLVTAPSQYRFNKVRDLVSLLGAEQHMVDETTTEEQYDALLTHGLSPAIGERITALRLQSDDYLNHVLS